MEIISPHSAPPVYKEDRLQNLHMNGGVEHGGAVLTDDPETAANIRLLQEKLTGGIRNQITKQDR